MNNSSLEVKMNNNEKVKSATDYLVEFAVKNVSYLVEQYEENHVLASHEGGGKLAMARLQWALDEGRASLNKLITEDEFVILLNVFNSEIVSPSNFNRIPTAILQENGIRQDRNFRNDYPSLATFFDKIGKLKPLGLMALIDLVEIYWHGPKDKPDTIAEFMLKMRVTPAEA